VISHPALLLAVIAGVTALAFWLDMRFRWASRAGATLLVILFGAILSNTGLVAPASPVYDAVAGPVTSLAIVWLLFAVDVRDLRDAGPRMGLAFAIAVAGTGLGAIIATLLFAGQFDGAAWKLAGVMTGTYAGGGLNFVAVGRAVDLDASLFTAATAADNLLTGLWMGATLLLPVWLRRHYPEPRHVHEDPGEHVHPFFSDAPLRVLDIAIFLALGLGLMAAADAVAAAWPAVPAVVWLTTFALAVGHTPWVRSLSGAMHLGSLTLHFFFVVLGIWARVGEIFRVGPAVFWFTLVVIVVHGLVTYLGCRVARLDVETTSVASQAAVGGPSSALALAVARDWPALILPGVVVGLLGYAVGNYLGLGIAFWMRGLLGG
jgi:uncharacterized membrane protein